MTNSKTNDENVLKNMKGGASGFPAKSGHSKTVDGIPVKIARTQSTYQQKEQEPLREVTNHSTAVNEISMGVRSMSMPPVQQMPQLFANPENPPNEDFSYQYTGHVDDIDAHEVDNPLYVTDYVQDMYEHFRQQEIEKKVNPHYMLKQTYINSKMRAILVDWLVEVHLRFKLVPETLYLCVSLIDRFLSKREVTRSKLQLVGVTCMFISSKYEEIYPPELRDLVYICDSAYTKEEIVDMEESVLKALNYKVTIPSAHTFLIRFLKAAHADKRMVQLSYYILDGSLQCDKLLQYLPSQLAAASIFVARRVIGRNSWSPTLLRYSNYLAEDIVPIARDLMRERKLQKELRAVDNKYASSRYGGVSKYEIDLDF